MVSGVILRTPKPGVLWNSKNNPASRSQRAMHLFKNADIVVDVLEYIECAYDAESFEVRDVLCIHLEQARLGHTFFGKSKAFDKNFAAVNFNLREGIGDGAKNKPGSATKFSRYEPDCGKYFLNAQSINEFLALNQKLPDSSVASVA